MCNAPVIYPDVMSPLHSCIVLPSNASCMIYNIKRTKFSGPPSIVGIRGLSTPEAHGSNVTIRPVVSYTTFSPLPAFTGGYFLLRYFTLASNFPLRSRSPCVARTFLLHQIICARDRPSDCILSAKLAKIKG